MGMKVSLNWLKEFVEIAAAPRELKAGLTSVGLGAESFAAAGDDLIFELEITTNRPDCLSHYGVAREIATLYRRPLKALRIPVQESGPRAAGEISIEIANPELCARYCGRVIRNVQVKPSPAWLAKRLEAVGMRPINNVADVTNYVLMELGHPLHAFDLEHLRQRKIIVRRAKSGERLRTLDGVGRLLKPDDLVIADGERAVALAGVMGGEDSEISLATHSVMLESAWFDPLSIRRTARSQGMHTEASHRFERGADIEMAPLALDRAVQLIAELAGGEVLSGRVDVYPSRRRRAALLLRPSELLRVLGAEVPAAEVKRILRSLGFEVETRGKGQWRVVAPSFRLDVRREIDLVEEVARHYGYERLPARLRPAPPRLARDDRREKELAVSSILVSQGYREIISSSMIDPAENARFTDRPPVVLANPLSQEDSVLRSTPIPSMLRALRWNLDRDQVDLRFFEMGKTYSASSRDPDGLPEERWVLTLGLSGHRRPDSVHERARDVDFFDLKGDLETLFGAFDIRGLRFEPCGCHYYEKESAGRFVDQSGDLAMFGELSREIARQYKFRQPLWLAEVDLERLFASPRKEHKYRPYSKFPAVERDFSLLVPQGTPYSRLAETVQGLGLEEIRAFRPVERLPEGKIAAGYYSLLLRVNFQSDRRTLTSEEIAEASRRLLGGLEPLGVRLRN
jgi:phenylalanyl-tRNA synthetase beta chain